MRPRQNPLPVSSNKYSACLKPDPWLRILVLTTGRLLIAASLVLILLLPIAAPLRAFACLMAGGLGYLEMHRLQAGFALCREFRVFTDGTVEVRTAGDDWLPGCLENGCLLLANVGWLRIRTGDGRLFADTVRGDARESQQWRRLQVIWRHIGADR